MRRREVLQYIESKRYRKTEGFKKSLFIIKLSDLTEFLEREPCKLEPFQRKGLANVQECLVRFLENMKETNMYQLEAFTSVSVESTDIIRASPNFYGDSYCSNMVVSGEDGFA